MSDNTYQPTKVWTWEKPNGDAFANVNRLILGATHEKTLLVGKRPLQPHSLGTSNGQKVTVTPEELLTQGVKGMEYDAWIVRIDDGDQFSSGFVEVNPNSKIPALHDHSQNPPVCVFESGAVLLYLAEKYGYFLPQGLAKCVETLNWLFWLQGTAPFLNDGFGCFYNYVPTKVEYAINRFTMEVKRLFDVLDKQLARSQFVAGDEYTTTDTAVWPRFDNVVLGNVYDAAGFLGIGGCRYMRRWAKEAAMHPAIK